jgi:hypothetical protein
MKPTPETDSFITYAIRTDHNWRTFARKLERERDDARAENEATRDAIKRIEFLDSGPSIRRFTTCGETLGQMTENFRARLISAAKGETP